MNASDQDKLPDDELIAQISCVCPQWMQCQSRWLSIYSSSTLTLAAMDTSSNALARILDLLSEHSEAQERLRQEVAEAYATHGGDLDYDTLNGLPFMEAVVRESLR